MTERIDRQPITMNTLYYGDNLKILRQYIPTESIDLIYLDPPFNSNRNYNVPKRVLVQVKSGHVKSGDIRDLRGTVEREKAIMGVFITLEEPTRDMKTEAVSTGYYESPGWNQKYQRIQILTIADLLRGAKIDMPPQYGTFKQAQKVKQDGAAQPELEM